MIVRAVALKDASVTGTTCSCTGAGQGTVTDLGGRACDTTLYGGVQYISCTAAGVSVFIQGNSSSGYTALNNGTDLIAFTGPRTCRASCQVALAWNCASATSTDRKFYRAAWTQTCAQTNNWIAAASVQ